MLEQAPPTNRELLYLIAELMGHKIDVYKRGKDWHTSVYYEGSVVIDGNVVSEVRAHLAVIQALPAYTTDVDVALTLPIDHERWFWTLMPRDSHGHAEASLHSYDMGMSETMRCRDQDGYLATAMCKAWAELKHLEEESKAE